MESLNLNVDQALSQLRLDQAIAATGALSRGKARKIIALGGCYLNRKRIHKNGALLATGDRISLYWHEQELQELSGNTEQWLTNDSILYTDGEIIAIHKPQGLPSQATKTQSKNHILAQLNRLGCRSALLVHRLDRDTSGVMLLAKSKSAYKRLSGLFQHRLVKKEYLCWVLGNPEQDSWLCQRPVGKIQASLGRVFLDEKRGSPAETHFQVLQRFGSHTLLLAKPVTGRTHQIRVHIASYGHPIIGDKNYGGYVSGKKMQLHASAIAFPYWKTQKILRITASGFPHEQILP